MAKAERYAALSVAPAARGSRGSSVLEFSAQMTRTRLRETNVGAERQDTGRSVAYEQRRRVHHDTGISLRLSFTASGSYVANL